MNFLVDTNVFCESVKAKPDAEVIAWLRAHESTIYISAVSVGEIRRGIELLSPGRRKTQLRAWLVELCDCMKGRVLSFNANTAHVWGQFKAKCDSAGISIASLDSQIAATAHRYALHLVTRNTAHFAKTGVKLFNPFAIK